MLGGYQILDLRSIDLSRGTSEAGITDTFVLAQLLNIRDHIQKSYDFSKPLHAQLKPLLIRYRDKKVGEKHEVACYGNIEVINTYYKFRIIANNEGEQLTINVEFQEKTDEYDNKYWDIKTAKILLTSAETTIENILADGNVENAKPIYYHGLELGSNTEGQVSKFYFNPHILSNSNELIDTIDRFIAWAKSIEGEVTINGNGVYTTGGVSYPMIMLRKNTTNSWALLYLDSSSGWRYVSIADDDALKVIFNTCRDSVNKIN